MELDFRLFLYIMMGKEIHHKTFPNTFEPPVERMIPQHYFQKSTTVPIRTGMKFPGFDKYSFHIEMLLNDPKEHPYIFFSCILFNFL